MPGGRPKKGQSPKKPLTPKEQKFVAAYVGPAKSVGAEAARMAGYGGNARNAAYRLLKLAHIAKAIREASGKALRLDIADRNERQTILTEIMRDKKRAAKDRLKAIELLARMHGDFIPDPSGGEEGGTRTILVYPVPMPVGADAKTYALPAGHAFDVVDVEGEVVEDVPAHAGDANMKEGNA